MAPTTPPWLAALAPARCAWGIVPVADGTTFEAWICEIDFPPYLGHRPDSLPGDCRKRSGLVAAADGSMSCSEVEVVRRLRAAGYADAGWLATCGRVTWPQFQRARNRIRDDLRALDPGREIEIPVTGAGAPDVVALDGPHPILIECKGSEPLQVNQVAWIEAVLSDEERKRCFSVVIRRGSPGVRLDASGSTAPHSPAAHRPGVLDEVSATGRPPASQGRCQFLTKAGRPCRNPGRYWRDGRWSCSRRHA